jgi:hypothetical protein
MSKVFFGKIKKKVNNRRSRRRELTEETLAYLAAMKSRRGDGEQKIKTLSQWKTFYA